MNGACGMRTDVGDADERGFARINLIKARVHPRPRYRLTTRHCALHVYGQPQFMI